MKKKILRRSVRNGNVNNGGPGMYREDNDIDPRNMFNPKW